MTRPGSDSSDSGAAAEPGGGFEAVWARAAGVEGWLSEGQARLLHHRASGLPPGAVVVEIGSFRGRSTIVLASAAPVGAEVVAIDPHAGGDRGPREIAPEAARGQADLAAFEANLAAAGVADWVRHVRLPSAEAGAAVDGDIDLLYVDGAHRFGPARFDLVGWGGRVRPGGTMLVHDAFSSVGVTLALLTTTFVGAGWRYAGRHRSLAEFERVRLTPGERLADALRQAAQLPWFLRNLAVKALIAARLAPVARLLGHRGGHWPY